MKGVVKSLVLAGAVAIVLAPVQARADGWIVPWIGSAFGSSIDNGRGTFGVSAGGMGGGVVGGEVDFGYNPSFFGTKTDFGNNSVINVMGNVIVGIPIGGTYGASVRPYVLGGAGLIRTQIDGANGTNFFTPSSSDNMFGWDAGAGVMGFFNDHVGLRGELRYLRGTHDMNASTGINSIDFNGNKLHFWRPSIGVVFR
jgi:opacity protein-like surface antigen